MSSNSNSKFISLLDKIFSSFDSIHEWQDFISFLSRLSQFFTSYFNQNHTLQHLDMNRKLILGKRLAQMLNPNLPAGVHLKVLDLYKLLLKSYPAELLIQDLAIWSLGLFPFSSLATMAGKKKILDVYLEFYVPLGRYLPLRGFILAILPFLEEENNDFFEQYISPTKLKASALLDKTAASTTLPLFYNALFRAINTHHSCRSSACIYLLRKMPKINNREDMIAVCGESAEVARGLVALLEDSFNIVKRSALDLILVQFEFAKCGFTLQERRDMIAAVLTVSLAREMALNRRLYTIVLPYESDLIDILRNMFDDSLPQTDLQKPYKILTCLLDRTRFGGVVDGVFKTLLSSLHSNYKLDRDKEGLIAVATVLFAAIDPYMFWKNLFFWLLSIDLQLFPVTAFLFDHFLYMEDETQRVHLPFFYFALTTLPLEYSDLTLTEAALSLANKMGSLISTGVSANSWSLSEFKGPSQEEVRSATSGSPQLKSPIPDVQTVITTKQIAAVYKFQNGKGEDSTIFKQIRVGRPIMESALKNIHLLIISFRKVPTSMAEPTFQRIWCEVCVFVGRSVDLFIDISWVNSKWLKIMKDISLESNEFAVSSAGLSIFFSIYSRLSLKLNSKEFKACVKKLWGYLCASNSMNHAKTVQALLSLTTISGIEKVEKEITLNMQQTSLPDIGKLGVLWKFLESDLMPGMTLSLPLCIIFNDFLVPNSDRFSIAENWISLYVTSTLQFLHPLILILTHSEIQMGVYESTIGATPTVKILKPYNQSQVLYAFELLFVLIQSNCLPIIDKLSEVTCTNRKRIPPWPRIASLTYLELIMLKCVLFILASSETGLVSESDVKIKRKACDLLSLICTKAKEINISKWINVTIYRSLLTSLDQSISPSLSSGILKSIGVSARIVYRKSTFGQLFPYGDAKEKVVSMLLKFLHIEDPIYQEYFVCFATHIPYFAPFFSSSLLIALQESCKKLSLHAESIKLNETKVDVTQTLAILNFLDSVLIESLKNDGCQKECLACLPAIFGVLASTGEIFEESDLFLKNQVTKKIGFIINQCSIMHSIESLEAIASASTWSLCEKSGSRLLKFTGMIPTTIVSSLFESLKKRNLNSDSSEYQLSGVSICKFLTDYICAQKGPEDLKNFWTSVHGYLKDFCVNQLTSTHLFIYNLRLLDNYFSMVTMENRKGWKDMHEIYQKVSDMAIQLAGRCFEKSGGTLRSSSDSLRSTGMSSSMFVNFGIRSLEQEDLTLGLGEEHLSKEALVYLADMCLLGFKGRLESDREVVFLSNICQCVISPALKGKDASKVLVMGTILKLLTRLVSVPSSVKYWKKDAWLAFMDPNFFSIGAGQFKSWTLVIQALISHEPEYLNDLIGKMSASLGLFSGKDSEHQERASLFRRLSFIILSAPMDFYLPRLPAIQEKIAESLKVTSPLLHTEIFLTLQVILTKISAKHMASLWLVVSYELYSIFSQNIKSLSKTKEESSALLEACKLLYVAVHLHVDDFQLHQWIFIADSPDQVSTAPVQPLVSALEQIINPASTGFVGNFLSTRSIQGPSALVSFFQSMNHHYGPEVKIDFESNLFERLLQL